MMRTPVEVFLRSCLWLFLATQAFAVCPAKGPGVTVCSPAPGAVVSSPVHFIASVSAACAKGISAIGIYSSAGKRVFVMNGGTLDTFLPLTNGSYNTTIQEWDNCGGSQRANLPITVRGNSVLTYQQNSQRTGANLFETQLNPSNVNSRTFGKLYSFPVDSFIYGQPLYVPNLQIGGASHNVVFVATQNNSVYAFDADNKSSAPLWHVRIDLPVPCTDVLPATGSLCNLVYLSPGVGITATPVIDPAQGAIYLVARTNPNNLGKYWQGIHKLDLLTGKELPASPKVIGGTVPGSGADSVNGLVTFNAKTQNARSALLYANGNVYVAFASINDAPIFHGWISGYDATTLTQVSLFNTTPNNSSNNNGAGALGGIWGAAVAADANNSIYAATGNGTWDNTKNDWANTYLRLVPNGKTLQVADYFTPEELASQERDDDLGTSTAILLPDQPGAFPHLMVGAGKLGTVYVMNRDAMGKYHSAGDQILQEIPTGVGVPATTGPDCNIQFKDCNYGSPAYWNGNIYFSGVNDSVKSFSVANGQLSGPLTKSTTIYGYPGAVPTISANGSQNAIVWTVEAGKAILHAYDANNLANELFNSNQATGGRDALGSSVKFSVPTVIEGKVFVGTQKAVVVYGLLP